MWRWTDGRNIKSIILDIDSLKDEYVYYDFKKHIPEVDVFEVSQYPLKPIDGHIPMEYYDIVELLYQIMRNHLLNSSEIVAISADHFFLKEMMQNHIGTIFVGDLEKDQLKHVPDFTNKDLNRILSKGDFGYGAEVIAISDSHITGKVLLKYNSIVELSNGDTKNIQLYFGGRYYPKRRGYILDDPLTTIMIDFKKRYNEKVDSYFDGALNLLNKLSPIDILTYVPMKPLDMKTGRFDRFKSLKLENMNKLGIHLKEIITCEKDFSQKYNDALHRIDNVRGAYRLSENQNVKDKTVVILDDLYTTGATIREISRLLYENGARSVIAVFLAVNQMIESSSYPYKRIKCSKCNGELILKVNWKNQLFFGCSNHPSCSNSLDKEEGFKILNQINQITIDDIHDLEDIY